MADIKDVPIKHVKKFLYDNNILVEDHDNIYDIALELIMKNDLNTNYNINSIIEWMMAYNLLLVKERIPNYTEEEIEGLSENNLRELANLLKMQTLNKKHMINILKFAHKLNYKLGFTGLIETDELIIKNSELRELIYLTHTNRYIKDLIYKQYPELSQVLILLNEYFNKINQSQFLTLLKKQESADFEKIIKINDDLSEIIDEILDLIIELLRENKIELVRKIINYFANKTFYTPSSSPFYIQLFNKVISNHYPNENVVKYLIELASLDYDMSMIINELDYLIDLEAQQTINYFLVFLKAAIRSNNKHLINLLKEFYYVHYDTLKYITEEIGEEDDIKDFDEINELIKIYTK